MPRPPTSGTRKGNGAGWGGPAKGAGGHRPLTAFTADNQPTPEAKSAGHLPIADMQEIKEFYTERMRDKADSSINRIAAADKLADRIAGKPKQAIDATFPGGTLKIIGGLPDELPDA
jgi:hypothetical protein